MNVDLAAKLQGEAQDTTDTYAVLDRLLIAREYVGELTEAGHVPPPLASAWSQWILSTNLYDLLNSELPRRLQTSLFVLIPERAVLAALDRLIWKESLAVAAAEWHAELHMQVDSVADRQCYGPEFRTARDRYRAALKRLANAER